MDLGTNVSGARSGSVSLSGRKRAEAGAWKYVEATIYLRSSIQSEQKQGLFECNSRVLKDSITKVKVKSISHAPKLLLNKD